MRGNLLAFGIRILHSSAHDVRDIVGSPGCPQTILSTQVNPLRTYSETELHLLRPECIWKMLWSTQRLIYKGTYVYFDSCLGLRDAAFYVQLAEKE